MRFAADEYYDASLLRLDEAWSLYQAQRYVGAVYLAGRAVEALLRAFHWKRHRELEAGHDLRELLTDVGELGLLSRNDREHLVDSVNEVAVVWNNDLRFASVARFERHLRTVGRDRRVGGRPIRGEPVKANAHAVTEACEAIVSRGVDRMATLKDKLERLCGQLEGGQAHLRTLPNGHVSGHVVSSEFENLEYEARRGRIRALIDDAVREGDLTPDDTLAISTILTYTPAEWDVTTISQ